jgi:hypothetical protein
MEHSNKDDENYRREGLPKCFPPQVSESPVDGCGNLVRSQHKGSKLSIATSKKLGSENDTQSLLQHRCVMLYGKSSQLIPE